MMSRANDFKTELAALCKKYNCTIEACDHWTGYAECGEDIRITVEFAADYAKDPLIPWEELDLGKYFDGNS